MGKVADNIIKTGTFLTIVLSIIAALFGFKGPNIINTALLEVHKSESERGKELASIYCVTCHLLPDPQSLDKTTWKNSILPNMGRRLGLKLEGKTWRSDLDATEAAIVSKMNIYPGFPLISSEDWKLISEYYVESAPKKLEGQDKSHLDIKRNFPFKAEPVFVGSSIMPQVTLLEYNEKEEKLFVGDDLSLYALDVFGTSDQTWTLESPATDLVYQENNPSPLLLTIGTVYPSDQKLGKILGLNENGQRVKFSQLKRPVDFNFHDLNGDSRKDLILSQFGNYKGKLSWFDDGDETKEHILSELPGARKTEVFDVNKDGRPDIIALMAQAREQITLFTNLGENGFEEKKLLEFPAVNGTNYFELADFNSDGFFDLLVTNGDNRDYSNIDKPYHGVRIYLNNGENDFKEEFFFPMYDCSKAMARDFDNDGDLDIIAASLFGSYQGEKKTHESIVYLLNNGNMTFTASYIPEAMHGNWLTMDVGDFNKDNLLDVVLGTYVFNIQEMMKIIGFHENDKIPQVLLLTQF
ncbi:FG-GAP repeat domain-containing protein [Maribacter sp. X9]|uniref:FG-GAP repeat domain-containing protein n=1 Tax=Maribacter sp. X9 TaxID=3402159 RepID=UPI003AF3B315